MTISDFVLYLQSELRYSQHTVLSYEKDLLQFQEFILNTESEQDLQQIKTLHIRNYIMQLSDDGLNSKSINRKIASIKKYYTYLIQKGIIESNPTALLKNLKVEKKVHLPFSELEMNELWQEHEEVDYKSMQERFIVETLYQTGIRRAELIGLSLENVFPERNSIKVIGKRNKERFIPVSENWIMNLDTLLQQRQEEGIRSEYVFCLPSGKILYPKFVYNVVKSYLSKVSLKEKKSPHMLRHTFATHLLNNGAEINAVKELLGHASLASTQVYTHQDIEALKKVFKESHPRENNE